MKRPDKIKYYKENLVQHRYLTTNINVLDCSDITQLGGVEALSVRASKGLKPGTYVEHLSVLREEPLKEDTKLILDHTRNLALGLATQTEQVGSVLALQNRALLEQNAKLESKLEYLVKQAEIAEESRLRKAALKEKRLSAKKQKVREALTRGLTSLSCAP